MSQWKGSLYTSRPRGLILLKEADKHVLQKKNSKFFTKLPNYYFSIISDTKKKNRDTHLFIFFSRFGYSVSMCGFIFSKLGHLPQSYFNQFKVMKQRKKKIFLSSSRKFYSTIKLPSRVVIITFFVEIFFFLFLELLAHKKNHNLLK